MTKEQIIASMRAISRIEWMVMWKDVDEWIFEDIEYIYNQLETELWLNNKNK